MSYVRFGDDSDVYIYQNMQLKYVCCMCKTQPPPKKGDFENTCDIMMDTIPEVLNHLEMHKSLGHMVPDYATERLQRENTEMERETEIKLLAASLREKLDASETEWNERAGDLDIGQVSRLLSLLTDPEDVAEEKRKLRQRVEDIFRGVWACDFEPAFFNDNRNSTLIEEVTAEEFGNFLLGLNSAFSDDEFQSDFLLSPNRYNIWDKPWSEAINYLYEQGYRA